MTIVRPFFAVALLPLLGCPAPTAPTDVALGEEFTLAPGGAAMAGEVGLRVTFESVTEDSRCPMDALCVTAGRVVVAVSVSPSSRRVALSPGEVAAVDGHAVRLVRVEPHPRASEPVPPSAYRATFVVEPR